MCEAKTLYPFLRKLCKRRSIYLAQLKFKHKAKNTKKKEIVRISTAGRPIVLKHVNISNNSEIDLSI